MICSKSKDIQMRRGETLKIDLFVRDVQTDVNLNLETITVEIECVNVRTGGLQSVEYTPKVDHSGYRIAADTSTWKVGQHELSVWITEADGTRRVSKSIYIQVA